MRWMILALAALTAGCGSHEAQKNAAALRTFDLQEPPPAAEIVAPPGLVEGAAQASTPAEPQIAYTYSLGYRLAADRVSLVQQRHVALCDRLGAARCHIVAMSREAAPGGAT